MNFNGFNNKKIMKAKNEKQLLMDLNNSRGWEKISEIKYIANEAFPFQVLVKYVG